MKFFIFLGAGRWLFGHVDWFFAKLRLAAAKLGLQVFQKNTDF
jgi:hypothetical protein